ncbi:MAG: hypothetical protein A3J51_00405 [Omnitrophica WOR_2 bacterium RIFCSPHIGHO2_02_FULL_45_21]|nr:MAG: hypothetical protein A3J51_00405 [Omnitrophica WOR_2 bacterium RIFCSPHIGHO2_02_FULL_45_21]
MDWKRSPIVGILAGVVIIATAVFITIFISQQPKYTNVLICEDTGTVFKKKLSPDAKFPITCPDSGKKTAYLAVKYTCQNGHTFLKPALPMLLSGAQKALAAEEVGSLSAEERAKMGSSIRCPICASTNVKGELMSNEDDSAERKEGDR